MIMPCTRRSFIKALVALPPALSFSPGWAGGAETPDPSRLALVIGNSAYGAAPLVNPANDARAIGALFAQAGFTVDSHLDATRGAMTAAIERFGAAARRSETRQVVFYYAGHGAQLDWRNYLLPVDAQIGKPEHIKQRCVDLGLLLAQFSAARDKTFIVILDACRNNPFGPAYRPEQKGLSQFDAPVGSLLAYATSPGSVAADGEGQNGLYTENLVRELSQRNTRIEDALKRVRLNVRLASQGAQIPWESTSLEGDVFIFSEGSRKLTEGELEQQLEADVTEWTRIKSSKRIDDWVNYLRTFPNGRFAEIAQMRLARLLAEVEKVAAEERQREEQRRQEERKRLERVKPQKPAPPAATKATPAQVLSPVPEASATPAQAQKPEPLSAAASTPTSPMIETRPGAEAPVLIAPSTNPFSAGRYPLGRVYTVGDLAVIRQADILTGIEEKTYRLRVTRVDYDEDRVEFNNGQFVADLMGNTIRNGPVEFDTPVQWTPAEFQVGKKWTAAFRRTQQGGKTSNAYYDLHIVKRETVSVPAGSFDSFRIEGQGWNMSNGAKLEVILWLVPGLNFPVRRDFITRNKMGRFGQVERHELVSLRQQTIETTCMTPTGALKHSHIIKSNCTP